MQVFDNIRQIVKDDLETSISAGSRLSIAAACFSIYAYQELKKQMEGIDELRFIFTSPAFTTEKAQKEKREFYIPRLSRERSLYGSEFEIKLRNELSQKAIAKECADWIRRKVRFRSNVGDEYMNSLCRAVNWATKDGKNMSAYSERLSEAIDSIVHVKEESDIDSFLKGNQMSFLRARFPGWRTLN
jgi:hypothetical protein